MKITILNARDFLGQERPNTFRAYCGRPSRNVKLGDAISSKSSFLGVYVGLGNPITHGDREDMVEAFRKFLPTWEGKKARKHIMRLREINQSRDVELVCWCSPQKCHCDVIKRCMTETPPFGWLTPTHSDYVCKAH